jgi:hypothetical protein
MRADGTFATVESVKVGDLLMGDDALNADRTPNPAYEPRRVLKTTTGTDTLYKIEFEGQKNQLGDEFTCNGKHVLVLYVMDGHSDYMVYNEDRDMLVFFYATPDGKIKCKAFSVKEDADELNSNLYDTKEEAEAAAEEYVQRHRANAAKPGYTYSQGYACEKLAYEVTVRVTENSKRRTVGSVRFRHADVGNCVRFYPSIAAARTAAAQFASTVDRVKPGTLVEVAAEDVYEQFATGGAHAQTHFRMAMAGVNYAPRDEPLLIDPWLLGFWLAAGSEIAGEFHVGMHETESVDALREHGESLGLMVRVENAPDDKPTMIVRYLKQHSEVTNEFVTRLRQLGICDSERLPARYKYGSIETRRAVLAGFIDGDGSRCVGTAGEIGYKFSQSATMHSDLFWDFVQVTRSLGFVPRLAASTSRPSEVTPGLLLEMLTIHVSGVGQELLPVRSVGKKVGPHRGVCQATLPFTIRKLDQPGRVVGFEVDGNHRFLLKSFIVTHNSRVRSSARCFVLRTHLQTT